MTHCLSEVLRQLCLLGYFFQCNFVDTRMNFLGDVAHENDICSLPQIVLLFDFHFDERVVHACQKPCRTQVSFTESAIFLSLSFFVLGPVSGRNFALYFVNAPNSLVLWGCSSLLVDNFIKRKVVVEVLKILDHLGCRLGIFVSEWLDRCIQTIIID